jgi:hypothetical protein
VERGSQIVCVNQARFLNARRTRLGCAGAHCAGAVRMPVVLIARCAGVVRALVVRSVRHAKRDRVLGAVLPNARCATCGR